MKNYFFYLHYFFRFLQRMNLLISSGNQASLFALTFSIPLVYIKPNKIIINKFRKTSTLNYLLNNAQKHTLIKSYYELADFNYYARRLFRMLGRIIFSYANRGFLLFFFCLIIADPIAAQTPRGTVSGKLQDSLTGKPLALATVSLYKISDSSLITYRLTDQDGNFKVPGLPVESSCRIIISFSGYQVYRKEIKLTHALPQTNLGTISLAHHSVELEDILVFSEHPPVIVRKDTIEFNANSFKTLPAALVEDLLKKLPGVDVGVDGSLSVHGKPVNRLLVDGREFFGSDYKVATRNLPADIIDKVQVTNDKEQWQRNPDLPPSQIGQVINLKLKKGIKQGWFGKAFAGGGTDQRYEAGAIANLFRDTLQVSVLGFTNNVNKASFSIGDLNQIGGFRRSGFGSMSINSEGGMIINGVSFGGVGQGLIHTTGGGINLNNQYGKDVTLNLQYFYGQAENELEQLSNRSQFLKDTVLFIRGSAREKGMDLIHRIGGKLTWKINPSTTLNFRPGISFRKGNAFHKMDRFSSSTYHPQLNQSFNIQSQDRNGTHYTHILDILKTYNKKGRLLNINNSLTTELNDLDYYNDIVNVFYVDGQPDRITLNQLRQRNTKMLRSQVNAYFQEPIHQKLSLRFSQVMEFFKESEGIATYNKEGSSTGYTVFNSALSNGLKRRGWNQTSGLQALWKLKKISFNTGLHLQWLSLANSIQKAPFKNHNYFYAYPSLRIEWNQISLSYRFNVTEPSAYDLQPIVDNTDPLFQQKGNPDLRPSTLSTIQLNYMLFNVANNSEYVVSVDYNKRNHAVVLERFIDSRGVQISRPINAKKLKEYHGSFTFGKQYKFNQDWKFGLRPSLHGYLLENLVLVNQNESRANTVIVSSVVSWAFDWKNKVEINQRYALNFRKTFYDQKAFFQDLQYVTHQVETGLVIRATKKWVGESSIVYRAFPQVGPGIAHANILWNGGLYYQFLKDDKGQLKISVYDLLNQNVGVQRTVNENYSLDIQATTLRRYYMISFTYNIRNFKSSKVGGKQQSLFRF